jgi:CubicO group peptidase (beta-lactamase class C family)
VTVHGFAGYAAGATIPSLIEILDGVPPANNQPIIVSSRPGHQFHYSGGGYTIVQKYLSDTTGESFEQLMRETVLTPLGMAHSAFAQPLPDGTRAEAATPYLSSGEPVTGGAHIYPELAAAGLWTTASDLARFAIALQNALGGGSDAVLPQNLARAMVTPVLDHYGLGLEVGGEAAQKYFAHDGVNFGFVSLMVAYETGDGAVIMTNGSREQLVREILRGLAAEYDWPDFRPTPRAAPAAH